MFRDTPRQWDAWDIDPEYRTLGESVTTVDALEVEESDERVAVSVTRSFGASTVVQTIALAARSNAVELTTEVDWHERQRMLKLAFPIDVHTASAASEIQFGHIVRPTHTNTSWDAARFETSAHRWVHVADARFGVAVANDSTYGHDITRHERPGGGTYSLVRQTLLRAPLFPDPEADQGMHTLRSSIVVGDIGDAIAEGYRLNLPLRAVAGSASASAALCRWSPATTRRSSSRRSSWPRTGRGMWWCGSTSRVGRAHPPASASTSGSPPSSRPTCTSCRSRPSP